MKNRPSRAQEFESHFSTIYGERWPRLRSALLEKPQKVTLANPFGHGFADYSLDPASLCPVELLAPQPGEVIADFCASPGGKSLAMIYSLKGEAQWHCNDLSDGRVARLKAVFHDCLPEAVRSRIFVTKSDASRWGLRRAEQFDRVLVDAPCSGERHLLATPKDIERWSLKSAKGLVVRQHALLCSALDCVKPGGRVVYSTCSIQEMENDGVIRRLQKSRAGKFEVLKQAYQYGESTELGWIILPDTTGYGPIYSAVIQKIN